ncbi:MAG TPA: secondary thiamine-phosphate synthase enzyme YjbQ [Spirochaetota bacterium]|nr:secondary thiamine-phosphate synthase enzyme YjbQ [Spirochaetota bacterium]
MNTRLSINTTSRDQMLDLTSEIQRLVTGSGVDRGFCYLFNPHTTAALTINENADPDVMRDILAGLDRTIPWKADYRHGEGNSAAHIKASLFGPSLQIMVEHGRLVLGTWQGIYFCEFDGPRQRHLEVRVYPVS